MEEKEKKQGEQGSSVDYGKVLGLLLGIIFLPALLLGGLLFWLGFVRGKNRISVLSVFIIPTVLIITILDIIFKITPHVIDFSGWLFWLALISLQIRIGLLLGLGYSAYQAKVLSHNEKLKHIPGIFKDFRYKRTPWENGLRKRIKEAFSKGEYFNEIDEAPIGITESIKYVDNYGYVKTEERSDIVFRFPKEATTHTIVTGASGSGKSLTLSQLIENDVRSGIGVTIIDNKKSAEFVVLCSRLAKKYNRKFYHFIAGEPEDYINPLGNYQSTYDPLASGNANTKADMIVNMRKWDTSSDVYKNQSKTSILTIWFLLNEIDPKLVPEVTWNRGGFWQFASALSPRSVAKMIEVLEQVYSKKADITEEDKHRLATLKEIYDELKSRGQSGVKNQIGEYRNIFSQFTLSSYNSWLSKRKDIPHIDLKRIILEEKDSIVLFSFNPQDEPEFSKAMGSLVLSDFSRVAAEKGAIKEMHPHRLYIDEFQTLPPERIKDNIEKARSANIGITLSLQSFSQVLAESSDAILQTIKDAVSNFIVHSGSTGRIAEMISELSGEGKIVEYSSTSNRQLSLFNLRKYNPIVNEKTVSSNLITKGEIDKLTSGQTGKSEIFLINKSCLDPHYKHLSGTIARKVQVLVSDEILAGVPKDMEEQWIARATAIREEREKVEKARIEEFNQLAEPDGDWGIEEESVSINLPKVNPFGPKSKYQDYFKDKKRRGT